MEQKHILVVAQDKPAEALRMASGLALMDASVRVLVITTLDESDQNVKDPLEALDFAEVPVIRVDGKSGIYPQMATEMIQADVVYFA